MIYIDTKRLILRDWQEEDIENLIAMNEDADVMKYFPHTLSKKESLDFYNAIQEEFRAKGYGLYAVEVKETAEFIGFIGFHKATFPSDFTPCIEIGWRLKKSAWNQGYATEGAKACLQYGCDTLHFKQIYSFTACINTPSEKVMKNIGMHYVKNFHHPRVDMSSPLKEHVLYEL